MRAVETSHTATRVDPWAVNNAHCQAHYLIVAEADPDVLCRILNYFALQCLTPRQVNMSREHDRLTVEIVIDGLSWHRAQVIAEKIRNLISVCSLQVLPADCAGPQAVIAATG